MVINLYSGERVELQQQLQQHNKPAMNEQQFKSYIESQALWRREEEQKRAEKEYLNDLVTNMIKSDGGNLEEFRRWSARIYSNAALLQNNSATIQLMLRTTLGALKDEIDRYILDFVNLNSGKNRLDVAYSELLCYLKRTFLPSNDIDHVRDSLDTLQQRSGETLRVFNRKFRDLAELAYPLEQRTADQGRVLIRAYIKSLHSKDTARAILRASPASLPDAMAMAIDGDEVEDALHRLGHRQEEPMDVSAVVPKSKPSVTVDILSKQLDKMNSKIAKMECQLQQGVTYRPTRQAGINNSRSRNGKPICYFCHQAGHIARHCPRKNPQAAPPSLMDVSCVPHTGSDQGNA